MSEPLSVLHVHSGNLFGGIESILVTLAGQEGGHMQHTFALCFPGRLQQELQAHKADVRQTAPVRLSRPWTVRRARIKLREILRNGVFDIAICHSAWSRTIFGPVLRAANQPFVVWQHSAGERQHWLDRLSRAVPTQLAICNSRYTANLQSSREPTVPTAVVHPPVPPPQHGRDPSTVRNEVRAELQLDDNARIILQAGRLEPGKGHSIHLRAAASLVDLPNWIIVQAGGAVRAEDRSYLLELEMLVRDLGLKDKVRFIGERTDMFKLYASADIYCQPNTLPESFGITFIEALYAGLPIVTARIGAAPEIVTEETGMLVPRDDPTAVAAALRTLLSDEATRARLGRNGPEHAKALCDPEFCINRLSEALSELVE